jgi:hypothetical protein
MFNFPKILHLYWDGSPMSKLQVLTVVSFHRYNPDWKIIVYMPSKKYAGRVQFIPDYTGQDYFAEILKLDYVTIQHIFLAESGIKDTLHDIIRSDIFRYKILYEFGGVWSDFDVLWLKPMELLSSIEVFRNKEYESNAFVCYKNNVTGHHSIGILGCTPRHPMYNQLIQASEELQSTAEVSELKHQSFGVDLWNTLFPTLYSLIKEYPDVAGIPYRIFYPYDYKHLHALFYNKDLKPIKHDTIAVHWFNGHKVTKEFLNTESRHKSSIHLLLNLTKVKL